MGYDVLRRRLAEKRDALIRRGVVQGDGAENDHAAETQNTALDASTAQVLATCSNSSEVETRAAWWTKSRKWVLTTIAAGLAAAIIPVVSGVFSTGGKAILAVTGISGRDGPISWTVSLAAGELNACHGWTFAKPISEIPIHDFSDGASSEGAWALANEGLDNDQTAYTVTVQGASEQSVILRDIRIKVLSRAPAVSGAEVYDGWGCGGRLELRYYTADVSAAQPLLTLMNPDGTDSLANQEYTVSKSNPEAFLLDADTATARHMGGAYLYTYVYQVDWSQGSNSGTADITMPNGKPFKLNQPKRNAANPYYMPVAGKWARLK